MLTVLASKAIAAKRTPPHPANGSIPPGAAAEATGASKTDAAIEEESSSTLHDEGSDHALVDAGQMSGAGMLETANAAAITALAGAIVQPDRANVAPAQADATPSAVAAGPPFPATIKTARATTAKSDAGDAPATIVAPPATSFADARLVVAASGGTDLTRGGAAPAPSIPAEAIATHHLDLAKDGAWLDGLARDIARSADAGGHLRFTLTPEHLGRLDVQLAAAADGTAIRLTTETREAHRIVSEAQPRLIVEARAQGLTVSETHVDLDQRNREPAQGFGNQNGGGGGQPQRQPAWPRPSAVAPVAAPVAGSGNDDLYA